MNTGVGCHFLLQGIFPTQGSSPGLPHCRQTLYHLSHRGRPWWQRWLCCSIKFLVKIKAVSLFLPKNQRNFLENSQKTFFFFCFQNSFIMMGLQWLFCFVFHLFIFVNRSLCVDMFLKTNKNYHNFIQKHLFFPALIMLWCFSELCSSFIFDQMIKATRLPLGF